MTVAILLLVCLVLAGGVVALMSSVRRLEHRLAGLERGGPVTGTGAPAPSLGPPVGEYVITGLGVDPVEQVEPEAAVDAPLFADLLLRETVVKVASLAYGVRRGLSPANRNRIWFEMRREVKRARKERKAEEREAVREWRARQRTSAGQEESAA